MFLQWNSLAENYFGDNVMSEPIIHATADLERKTWEEIESISSPTNQQHYYDTTNDRRVCYIEHTGWVTVNIRGSS